MPALDGLRGLAILLVIAHNVQLLDTPDMHGAVKLAQYLMNVGWIGVQLFFVLSGFLITGILLDNLHKPHALRNFMARRALRIFPLYYGVLLLIFVILPAIGAQPAIYAADAPYQVWMWTYLVNWTSPLNIGHGSLPHFWSLAVEEQFYLVWPLLVIALRTPARIAWLCALTAVGSLACRAWLLQSGSVPVEAVYEWTICRIDALAMGALAACLWRMEGASSWLARHRVQLAWATLAVVAATFLWTKGFPRHSPRGMTIGYTVLALAFTVWVYLSAVPHPAPEGHTAAPTWMQRCLSFAPLRSVGKYSYGMYVFHKPLHDLFSARVLRALHDQPAGHILDATLHIIGLSAVAYVVAWLSYHLYEQHFLNLKARFA